MASSYNGWPASRDAAAIGINRGWEPIAGHDFPGGIKSGDVQTVFTCLVRQLHKRVEPIVIYPPGDEWGYAYRDNVNNPGQLSCHASGTAIDYNATEHPNRVDYTWSRDQTREIHKIIDDELDGVIKWLEGYDEMHFEIRGTAAQVAAVAKKIRAMTTPPPADEDDDMPLNDADKEWLRSLATEIAGKRTEVTAHGQTGVRRDVWRWTGEAVTLLRQMSVNKIVAGVVASIEAGDVDEATLTAAVEQGVRNVLRDDLEDG
jgi:hypothetical protein